MYKKTAVAQDYGATAIFYIAMILYIQQYNKSQYHCGTNPTSVKNQLKQLISVIVMLSS